MRFQVYCRGFPLRSTMAFLSCAFRYTQPSALHNEFPQSSMLFRPYFCCEFPNAFAYLLHKRFPLCMRHVHSLCISSSFPCLSFAISCSVCFSMGVGVSPKCLEHHSLWVPPCAFPFVSRACPASSLIHASSSFPMNSLTVPRGVPAISALPSFSL